MRTLPAIILLMVQQSVYSAKLLMISGPATSHCLEMISISDELLKRGHQVTFYSNVIDAKHCVSKINPEHYKSTFRVVVPHIDPSVKKTRDQYFDMIGKYFFERRSGFVFLVKHMSEMLKTDCDVALKDMKLIKELRKDKYDIAVVQGAPLIACLSAIPILLDVPSVAVSSFIDPQDSRMPLQSNTLPSLLTQFSNEMNFVERVVNTVLFLLNPLVIYLFSPSLDLSQYSEELAGCDPRSLLKESVLFLENTDYVVDYPRAVFPNFVQVGGLTAVPVNPLPSDLKKLVDSAKSGTVLVTFGSMLKSMPLELKGKLMEAFLRLNHQVLLKGDEEEVRGNVHVLKWVPQNDILGHNNTKLFISHCGKNGFYESVYHAVPIICMPLHAETHTTKVKVMKYGIGSSINIFDDSVDDLVKTINGVLSNDSIYWNIKRISTLLRDRPETPRERAASAIEQVIKYGGDHMRPPSVDFGFLSYLCVDVWFTLLLIGVLIVAFDIWLIRRCCCKGKSRKPKTE